MATTISNMEAGSVHRGFTIVELMIVISVIAILATISIVSYNGAQEKAHDSAIQSDLDNTAGLLESHRVHISKDQHFPGTTAELEALDIRISKKSYDATTVNNLVYCLDTPDNQAFALISISKSGNVFMLTEEGIQENTEFTNESFTSGAGMCGSLSMSLVSSGMNPAGTWQTWAHGG